MDTVLLRVIVGAFNYNNLCLAKAPQLRVEEDDKDIIIITWSELASLRPSCMCVGCLSGIYI